MRLLTVEQEVDGFPYLFVLNLAVEVFVYYLGPLLGCNIAQQIRAEISSDSDIVCRPGIAGGVDETGIQTKQNMCFDLACLDLVCLHVMTVEQIDGLSSAAISINRSLILGFLMRKLWDIYCMAAFSSPLPPPSCSCNSAAY